MKNNRHFILLLLLIIIAATSCSSSKSFSSGYYAQNKVALNDIEASYKDVYKQHPFALQFTSKYFNEISIDIITDSIKYVYVFRLDEVQRLNDTLSKYGISSAKTLSLANQMKLIHCTWINNLDYYVDGIKHYMVFMSVRQLKWHAPFLEPKYYVITYFSTPQYFDNQGRLLDKRRTKRLRKINGDVFYRINDKVCYTLSVNFR
jgi:hypothetical protein